MRGPGVRARIVATTPPHTPYSIAKATLIAEQLSRLASEHPHQLAGQLSNLDFWMAEAAAAVTAIDEYPVRFRKLRDSQVAWVRARALRIPLYCPICNGECAYGSQPHDAPRRVPTEALSAARNSVTGSAVQLLLRLYDSGLIGKPEVNRHVDALRLPLEPDDLHDRARSSRG